MKKKIWTSMLVTILLYAFSIVVFAGSINTEEQRIIDAISAIYVYNGEYYKVTDAYIAQVTAYLNQDSVDMTKSEVDSYLSQFYANIGVAISSGYMEKVELEDEKPSENDKDDKKDKDEKPSGSENGSGSGNGQDESQTTEEETTETATESATDENKPQVIVVGDNGAVDMSSTANSAVTNTTGSTEGIVDNTLGSTTDGVIEYTVVNADPQDMYVWDIETLNVHAEAYKDSEILGTLQKGDKVLVTGAATTGWAQIEYDGGIGYVSAVYLRTDGYMIEIGEIEPETIEETTEAYSTEEDTTEATSEEMTTVESAKDYSDAEPYQSQISLGMIAIIIVVIVACVMIGIVIWHKNKSYKK